MPTFGCVSVDVASVASVQPSIHVLSEAFQLKLQLSLKKQIVFFHIYCIAAFLSFENV